MLELFNYIFCYPNILVLLKNANKIFKFRYALVLEDGGHDAGQNPLAQFYMVKGSSYKFQFPRDITIMNQTARTFTADVNDPFYKVSSRLSSVVYRNWECVEYDLSAYVGQTVTFVAWVRDCVPTAHFGYMYIDGLCTSWPAIANMTLSSNSICLEQPLMMNGATTEGEESYYVEVLEWDPITNWAAVGGLDVHDWFVAQQAPNNFNIRTFITDRGKQLKCGKKYKVKLAVWNKCSQWNETNQYFTVDCPSLNIGPDIVRCCSEGVVEDFSLNATRKGGIGYSWSSFPAGYLGNSPILNFNEPTQNTAFFANVTFANGCIARDTALFLLRPDDYTISLTQTYKLCELTSKVKASLLYNNCSTNSQVFFNQFGVPENNLLQWYFKPALPIGTPWQYLEFGETITAPNQDGILEVRLANSCVNLTETQSMNIYERPQGTNLICGNAFTPDGGSVNNVFRIFEYGPMAPQNVGEGPAYGIIDFQLRIWNRWGVNFRTVTKSDVGRAPNDYLRQGDIYWDGKDNSGTVVQDGAYVFQLWVKYCGQTNFVLSPIPYGAATTDCIDWSVFGNCQQTMPFGWGASVILVQ